MTEQIQLSDGLGISFFDSERMSIYDRKLAMKFLKDKYQAHSKMLEETTQAKSQTAKRPRAPRLP